MSSSSSSVTSTSSFARQRRGEIFDRSVERLVLGVGFGSAAGMATGLVSSILFRFSLRRVTSLAFVGMFAGAGFAAGEASFNADHPQLMHGRLRAVTIDDDRDE